MDRDFEEDLKGVLRKETLVPGHITLKITSENPRCTEDAITIFSRLCKSRYV